jgi:hypothetical protein
MCYAPRTTSAYSAAMPSPEAESETKPADLTVAYLGIAVATTLVVCTVLALNVRAFDVLPYWFLHLHRTVLDVRWVGAALASLAAAFAAIGLVRSVMARTLSLVLLAWVVQLSFSMSRGEGFEGLRSRIVTTGHAEFARVAVREPSLLDVARHYEQFVRSGRLGSYAQTKPPGTLLVYMATERVSGIICASGERRLACMQTFAAWTWSFFSCLVIVPLFHLARRWGSESIGGLSCLLYMATPTVNIFTLHLDQVLFPLLSVSIVGCIALALDSGRRRFAVVAGCLLYFAVFCSFGLALIAPLAVVPFIEAWSRGMPSRAWARPILYAGIGLIACALIARVGFSYELFVRYGAARAAALAWRGWDDSLDTLLRASLTNLVEFSIWTGLALALAIVCVSSIACERIWSRTRIEPALWLGPVLSLTVLAILLTTKTKTESSRLWLFLVPFCCICTAWLVQHDDRVRTRWLRWGIVIACQLSATVALLAHSVFF